MNNLEISKLIAELEESGLTQKEIADGIGHGISQSTVCDLKTGRLKSIRYERGVALVKLHKSRCPKAA